jgi:hypothetical protein
MEHPALSFYRAQFWTTIGWWLLVRIASGQNLYDVANSSVFTRPSWLGGSTMRRLHAPQNRKLIFCASVASLGAASFLGGHDEKSSLTWVARLGVAFVVSFYHLLETSTTQRHGEYPLLYNVWAMCIPLPAFASAASLGIAIHFLLSAGIAKLLVGGRAWFSSATMQHYLSVYRDSRAAPPLSKKANQFICARPWAATCISAATIAVECVLVPLTLFLPPSWRFLATFSVVCMHVGIGAFMSLRVGLVFFTTLPAYVIGFQSVAACGSTEWWLAALVGLAPSLLVCASRKLLPDIWPCSSVSLFMWSGEQARALSEKLMCRDTRLVVCTSETLSRQHGIIGLPGAPQFILLVQKHKY